MYTYIVFLCTFWNFDFCIFTLLPEKNTKFTQKKQHAGETSYMVTKNIYRNNMMKARE